MSIKFSIVTLLIIVCFSNCIPRRQAYYVSPFNANSNVYHTIPLHDDSIKSATYISGLIMLGSANDGAIDKTFIGQVNISRSHNFGSFQAFYSGNFSLGNYHVRADSINRDYSYHDYAIIDRQAGNKLVAGAGIDAGINYVLTMRGGEWRIGMETSAQNDYGGYYNFRKNLPDSAADIIIRNRLYATIGGYTELIGNIEDVGIGLKMSIGTALGRRYNNAYKYYGILLTEHELTYNYVNFNFNVTVQKRYTAYMQANFASKGSAGVLGFNYRLGK